MAPPAPIQLRTMAGCGLAIAGYPPFRYDALGGGGDGALGSPAPDGRRPLTFSAANLTIPALSWRTTRVFGLPLPPGVVIAIEPEELAGHVEEASGHLELRFRARFHCRLAGLYQPPPLQVHTLLTTRTSTGRRHRASGRPRRPDGRTLLVGVAAVPPSGDRWLDRFLGLPDEALALLHCSVGPRP